MDLDEVDRRRSHHMKLLVKHRTGPAESIEDQQGVIEAYLCMAATVFCAKEYVPFDSERIGDIAGQALGAFEDWLDEWKKRN